MLLFIAAPHHSHSFLASSLNAFVLLFFLMQTDCCLTCLFFLPTWHVSVCELAVISILSFVCQIFFQTSIAQLVPALCLFKFAFVPLLLQSCIVAVNTHILLWTNWFLSGSVHLGLGLSVHFLVELCWLLMQLLPKNVLSSQVSQTNILPSRGLRNQATTN